MSSQPPPYCPSQCWAHMSEAKGSKRIGECNWESGTLLSLCQGSSLSSSLRTACQISGARPPADKTSPCGRQRRAWPAAEHMGDMYCPSGLKMAFKHLNISDVIYSLFLQFSHRAAVDCRADSCASSTAMRQVPMRYCRQILLLHMYMSG